MKKIIIAVLAVCFVLGLVTGCGPQENISQNVDNDVNGQDYFDGKILEITDTYILVKCLEVTSGAISAGTEANVSTDVVTAV